MIAWVAFFDEDFAGRDLRLVSRRSERRNLLLIEIAEEVRGAQLARDAIVGLSIFILRNDSDFFFGERDGGGHGASPLDGGRAASVR